MRNPDFRARILAEEPGRLPNLVRHILTRFDKQFRLGDPPDYEPRPETSIQHQTAAANRDPRDLVYDILLENEGREFIYVPLFNYAGFDLEPAREMMLHPHTVLGLGDGGAQDLLQVLRVVVLEHFHPGPAQAYARDDALVVQGVGDHEVALADEQGDGRRVGREAHAVD